MLTFPYSYFFQTSCVYLKCNKIILFFLIKGLNNVQCFPLSQPIGGGSPNIMVGETLTDALSH